jgi:hypothetical protein
MEKLQALPAAALMAMVFVIPGPASAQTLAEDTTDDVNDEMEVEYGDQGSLIPPRTGGGLPPLRIPRRSSPSRIGIPFVWGGAVEPGQQ